MADKSESKLQTFIVLKEETAKWEHAVVRGLFLINGGALIACMTVIGNNKINLPDLAWPMIAWVLGLALASVTGFFAYFAQRRYHQLSGHMLHRDPTKMTIDQIGKKDSLSISANKMTNWFYSCGGLSLSFFIAGSLAAIFFVFDPKLPPEIQPTETHSPNDMPEPPR